MRRTYLERLAGQHRVERLLRHAKGIDDLLDRFLAGESPASAAVVSLDLAEKGLDISFAQTAPTAVDEQAARTVADDHLAVIRLAAAAGATGFDVSLGLPSLGLTLGADGPLLALGHVREVAAAADAVGATVTVDTGRSEHVDDVLATVLALRPDHPTIGVTLQSKLRRSATDLADISQPGSRVRLCKGAFPADEDDAYQSRIETDRSFVRLLRALMESQAYPMTATHDPRIVSINHDLVRRNGRTREDYEFQMLMGVRPFEHRRLVDTGRRLRVYLPYGRDWYPYLLHRIHDHPGVLSLIGRQLVSRR